MKKHTDYVLDREGNAVVGAEVYVRKQSDNTLVDLYSDDGSTLTSNPTTTDSDGEFSFWTANQTLKLQVFVDGVQEQEVTNFQHWDLDALTDPAADKLVFWDDSAGELTYIAPSSDFAISGTTLSLAGGLAGVGALADPNADRILFWDDSSGVVTYLAPSTGLTISGTSLTADSTAIKPTESLVIACSDETTALTTGAAKITFRMPYAFTLSAVRASLTTAQTSGSIFTVDINEGGSTILSTKLTIDNAEKTSTTAATAAVISDSSIADDAEMTIDIDQVGDGTAKGLKVVLIGTRT